MGREAWQATVHGVARVRHDLVTKLPPYYIWGFPGGYLPMQEMWFQSLGWEHPLKKETATHSSILAWEIPWTEELDGP